MRTRKNIAVGSAVFLAAALVTLFLIFGARTADAQPVPPPAPPGPDPLAPTLAPPQTPPRHIASMSIDELAQQLIDIRQKRAELDKAEKAVLEAITAKVKQQTELLQKLGVLGGNAAIPPPVEVPAVTLPVRADQDLPRATPEKK